MILHYTRDVAMQFFLPNFADKCIAVFYSKYNLKIELCIGISH